MSPLGTFFEWFTLWRSAELIGLALVGLLFWLWYWRLEAASVSVLAGNLHGVREIRAALDTADRVLNELRVAERDPLDRAPLTEIWGAINCAKQWARRIERGHVQIGPKGVEIRGELIPSLRHGAIAFTCSAEPLYECPRCGFREWSEADWLAGSPMRPPQRCFGFGVYAFEDGDGEGLTCPNCTAIIRLEAAG